MRLFVKSIKHVVIGCLCGAGALTAVACADGGLIPTSPDATQTASIAAATPPRNGGTAPQAGPVATAVTKARPFHGSLSLEGDEEPVFEPPFTLSVHFAATGVATHLGRFTGILDVHIDVSQETTQTSTGTLSLTAANGDHVFASLVGAATVAGDIASIVETCTITGGTGRFAYATGSFVIERVSNLATGAAPPGSFAGNISY
jgi:hypothetical protein